jgi:hypothetical protein
MYPMSENLRKAKEHSPLRNLGEWEDDVIRRYPEPGAKHKSKEEFRQDTKTPRHKTLSTNHKRIYPRRVFHCVLVTWCLGGKNSQTILVKKTRIQGLVILRTQRF